MKKIIAFLSILLVTIISCTTDDTSQNLDSSVLPKKIIYTEGATSSTLTLSYNGNKIKETIDNNGYKSVYTYTGDLITNVTSYKGDLKSITQDYTYENGILKSVLFVKYSTDTTVIYKLRSVYTPYNDGTILEERYSVDSKTSVETKLGNSEIYTFLNGNLTKQVSISTNTYVNGTNSTTTIYKYTYIFEYDNKNNPAVNIIGLNKIEFSDTSSKNNITKITNSEITANGVPSSNTNAIINYTLSYNSANFLTENTYIAYDGNNNTTYKNQYFYE